MTLMAGHRHDIEHGGEGYRRSRRKAGAADRDGSKFRLPAVAWIGLAFILVTTHVPIVMTLSYSLVRWNLQRPELSKKFVGVENFRNALKLDTFYKSLGATLEMTFGTLVIILVVGLGMALLINRPFRGRAVVRTLMFAPFLVPPTTSALMWKTTMLDPGHGLVNWIGGLHTDWLAKYPMGVIVAITAWQWAAFTMLILYAGLQNEDLSVKEAARCDGAGVFRVFRHVTLPHLMPHFEVPLVLGTVFVSQLLDPIFMLTQGGPGSKTTTAAYQIYQLAFEASNIGLGSAYAIIVVALYALVMLLLVAAMRIYRRRGGGG